ncbi:hypothetical protein Pcinc_040379, partial [Petrolisthes cinctipes]
CHCFPYLWPLYNSCQQCKVIHKVGSLRLSVLKIGGLYQNAITTSLGRGKVNTRHHNFQHIKLTHQHHGTSEYGESSLKGRVDTVTS